METFRGMVCIFAGNAQFFFFLITSKNKQEQDTYILATSIVIEIFCSYFNGKSR